MVCTNILNPGIFTGCPLRIFDHLFTGCEETLVLNMSKLVWSVLTTVKQRDPLASEVPLFAFL